MDVADYVWWVVADYVWWDVADYVWWDVADYVSILKSNSATTNEAASYSRLGIDGSFRTIKNLTDLAFCLPYDFPFIVFNSTILIP